MNAPDSPKTANSLGEFVQHALEVRQQWLAQHDSEADEDEDLREDWKALKPFWKPWFRGHEDATWELKPKLYRGANRKIEDLFACEEGATCRIQKAWVAACRGSYAARISR
jgi:hypothetical protein